jgi:hypothetical protein
MAYSLGTRACSVTPERLSRPMTPWWTGLPGRLRTEPGAWVLSVLVVLVTWPASDLVPRAGLDASWRAGLAMAARQGLRHGEDVLFTYGPLGFLGTPPHLWFAQTAALTMLFTIGVHICFVRAAWDLVSRQLHMSLLVLLPILVLISSTANYVLTPELTTITLVAVLLTALLRSGRISGRMLALVALVAAVQILVKFNQGVVCFGLLGLAALADERRSVARRILAAGAGSLLTLVLLWLAAGQELRDLWQWILGSLAISSGYTEAMSKEVPGRWVDYVWLIVSVALVGAAVRTSSEALPARRRVLLAALVAWFMYVSIKHGFVRHDTSHAPFVAFTASILLLSLSTSRAGAWRFLAAAAGFTIFLLMLSVPAPPPVITAAVNAPASIAEVTMLMISSDRREAVYDRARERVDAKTPIEGEMINAVAERDVHVLPYHTGLVWAHKLNWRPLPVFQQYSAYTPHLDNKNAAVLREPQRRPDVVLYEQVRPIDGRVAAFESPETTLALLCNYRAERRTKSWQLLTADSDRCEEQVELPGGPVEVTAGEIVSVPSPSSPFHAVYARVDPHSSKAVDVLRDLLKPYRHVSIQLDGSAPGRLVEANMQGPLLLHVPGGVADLPALAADPNVEVFTLSGRDRFTVRFYEMAMAP